MARIIEMGCPPFRQFSLQALAVSERLRFTLPDSEPLNLAGAHRSDQGEPRGVLQTPDSKPPPPDASPVVRAVVRNTIFSFWWLQALTTNGLAYVEALRTRPGHLHKGAPYYFVGTLWQALRGELERQHKLDEMRVTFAKRSEAHHFYASFHHDENTKKRRARWAGTGAQSMDGGVA